MFYKIPKVDCVKTTWCIVQVTPNTVWFQPFTPIPVQVCEDITYKEPLYSPGEEVDVFIANGPHIEYQRIPMFLKGTGK